MCIHAIVYRSAPIFSGTVSAYLDEIEGILATARRRNAEVAVTGVMLFNEDWFVQLLEGSEEAVRSTFERISLDPRHEQVEILFDSPMVDRHFPEWSMAFVGDAQAIRTRFTDSPLSDPGVRMRGREVVDFIVALADTNRRRT